MEEHVGSLISRYRDSGVLVDTNLLLLFFVGGYDRALVERFRRTADRFVSAEFDVLSSLLAAFDRLVVTPHVLTETNNLLGQLADPARTECLTLFARSIPGMKEVYVPGTRLSGLDFFVKFGITDTSIMEVAAKRYLVLTDDFPLFNLLATRGADVLNFNHVRTLG